MRNDEVIACFEEYYDNHMWMTEGLRGKLNEYLATGKELTVEKLKSLLENEEGGISWRKRCFFTNMASPEAIRNYYKFNSLFFPVGKECEIEISGKYKYLRLVGSFKVIVLPYYEYDLKCDEEYTPFTTNVEAKDRKVSFKYTFDHEDCYKIALYYVEGNQEYILFTNDVYALEDDLYELQYYKADLHMHTYFSDGIESPALVAASSRERGMDIIAVTDHNSFEGSVVARERVKEMGLNMTVILGEEYAMAYSPMHILAYGTEKEIDRKYLSLELANTDEVKEIIAKKGDANCDLTTYACTQALLDEVRRQGGVSVLAHPYWKPIRPNGRKDTPESVFIELSKDKRFDGVEVVSGSKIREHNVANLQAAFAQELLNYNLNVPIIGVTDSHCYTNDPITGIHYTVIFSISQDPKDVIEALKAGRCVAVEMVDGIPLCYGKHRYMKFVNFLITRYFPERDRKAMVEAILAKERYICNE